MSTKIFPHRRSRRVGSLPPLPVVREDPIVHRLRVQAERASAELAAREREQRRQSAREAQAERDEALARANALAEAAFPWSRIGPSVRALDLVARPAADAPVGRYGALIRGRLIAIHHVFGRVSHEAMPRLLTGTIDRETWEIIGGVCPLTTNNGCLSKIVEFLVTWAALLSEHNRTASFRAGVEAAAEITQCDIAERIEAARESRDRLTLQPLGDDWFTIRSEHTARMIWQRIGSPFGSYETAVQHGRSRAALRRSGLRQPGGSF